MSGSDTNNVGSSRVVKSTSLSSLLATLAPIALVAAIYFVVFLILRRSQRRYYAPRTYLGSLRESERTPALPSGLFNWFGAFWRIPDVYALQHQSLDAYLYLRYMRMTIVICFVGCCITWPILFPVNATGGAGQEQLDILSYANINLTTENRYRYIAHAIVLWLYFGYLMYFIMRECIFYINLRQAFLLSSLYANRLSTRTVLFTSVPTPYLDEHKLRKVFGDVVEHIWITGETKHLDELVEQRDKTAYRLENAEVKLIKLANDARRKALAKGGAEDMTNPPLDAESGSVAARWVPRNKRPTHRTGRLGLIGKKVDTIDWCRSELEHLIPDVEAAQAQYRTGNYKKIPAVFIQFKTQAMAESAAQVLAHHQGFHMSPRYIGITPGEVVWSSLTIPWWQKVIRGYAVTAFVSTMVIFWAIPVAAIGVISNVDKLKTISWLTWLNDVPQVVMGFITGLLPSVALAILMSLVPVVMRLCARLAGEPSLSRVELYTQKAYFAFQVIQVFLVCTMTSAASAVAKQVVDNPTRATEILANNLPKASNFYISYFIVQGLSVASGVISQVAGFVIFSLLYRFLAGTPRALYQKWANLSAISWGSTLPVYTNITVIAITYTCISPLVLGFATIGMALFYFAWRYNVLFVTDTQIDTRGLIYPVALKQLFTGMYIGEICMIGLFGASVAPIPLVLTVVLLVFTALFHVSLNNALDPLLYNLPQTLLAEEQQLYFDAGTADGVHPRQDSTGSPTAHERDSGDTTKQAASKKGLVTASSKKGNMLTKFLKPWAYSDYVTLRGLVPHDAFDIRRMYEEGVGEQAYYPPSITATPPLLWIPSDPAGVSKQEVAHTSRIIPITDEGAELDDKGKIVWDHETTRPPVWEEKIIY